MLRGRRASMMPARRPPAGHGSDAALPRPAGDLRARPRADGGVRAPYELARKPAWYDARSSLPARRGNGANRESSAFSYLTRGGVAGDARRRLQQESVMV